MAWDLWGDDSTPTDVFRSTNIPLDLGDDAYRDLTNTFFDCRWSYLPVLHRPTFVNEHLNPFLSKSVTSPISVFLVNMVCAIATTEKSSFQEDSQVHRSFFNRAVQDLHIVMGIDDLQCVQCLLLLCMYGHNEPQSVNMWYTTGLALQLAIGMDLHRKESLWGHGLLCTEIFKRIFWCSYVMNCNMAINMGRPLGIHESDITMPLPLPLTDDQLSDSCVHPDLCQTTISQTSDISAFIHIIQLRKINAAIYKSFHPIGRILLERQQLDAIRRQYFSELNNWLVTSPRYPRPSSTFQTTEWFQIAFHHATLSLYRPSRAIPMPSSEDLGICMESAIGLISAYSSLYARNRIKYTFVAIHSLFMAAVAMLYALRVSLHLRQELTRPVYKRISSLSLLYSAVFQMAVRLGKGVPGLSSGSAIQSYLYSMMQSQRAIMWTRSFSHGLDYRLKRFLLRRSRRLSEEIQEMHPHNSLRLTFHGRICLQKGLIWALLMFRDFSAKILM